MDADLYKITPEDFTGKGVSAQSNPMELPEDEAKAVFDQLAKEVITPKFNEFVDALADLDITPDADKPISTAVQQALDRKIDRERRTGSETAEKVLSDNNYSDEEKEKVQCLWDKTLRTDNVAEYFPESEFHPATVRFVRDNTLPRDNTEEYHPTLPFHPATVDYVDKKVVAIGAADMTKAVYDPNSRATDIFAYTDRKADDAKYMTDDVTGKRYFLGVSDGGLFYEEATE